MVFEIIGRAGRSSLALCRASEAASADGAYAVVLCTVGPVHQRCQQCVHAPALIRVAWMSWAEKTEYLRCAMTLRSPGGLLQADLFRQHRRKAPAENPEAPRKSAARVICSHLDRA